MTQQSVTVQAPGRINLIGEHTDYNDGLVLPAAIDKLITFELEQNGTADHVSIIAADTGEEHFFNLSSLESSAQGWQRYMSGALIELQQSGAQIAGFTARFSGNLPIGAGMSSSAALVSSFVAGLNELFELRLTPWEIIEIGQRTEHKHVGLQCGIMDQFASIMGQEDHLLLLDCRDRDFRKIPIDTGDYRLLLLNTGVSHTLAESAYNRRRQECALGLSILQKRVPEITSLRDVTDDHLTTYYTDLPEVIYWRCRHVVSENQRVLDSVQCIQGNDMPGLGQLLLASHRSLQHDYQVSCEELDFLVELGSKQKYVLGSRMMGGGFGGCTINLVHKNHLTAFIDTASTVYERQFNIKLEAYQVHISDGAKRVAYEQC